MDLPLLEPPVRSWSLTQRVVFRLAFVFAVVTAFPWPLGLIPGTSWLADLANAPWTWLVGAVVDLLGVEAPQQMTGSGDTMWWYVNLLVTTVVAVLGATVWSVLDRRRVAYSRLAALTIVYLRYYLAYGLLAYGLIKIIPLQFSFPEATGLDRQIGEMSPMSVLWTFMGASPAYTIFSGIVEALGGLLLLSRRTATLGALLGAAVMTNVVALNFCYDVPVKLYSMQLLVVAIVLVLPQAGRLVAAMFGGAVAAVPPRARMSVRHERLRLGAKLVMVAAIAYGVVDNVRSSLAVIDSAPHELEGRWVVETYVAGGIERPPLLTDGGRWHKLLVNNRYGAIRTMNGELAWFQLEIDEAARTIALTGEKTETWTYALTHTSMTLDGVVDATPVHVVLVRQPPPLLATRGFHWIQEVPFNR